MKKEVGKYLAILLGCICIILVIILIYVKTSTVSAKADTKNLKSKIEEEVSYLDSNIIKIMNKLNNITVINYKVYTREINESGNSSESSSGGSSQGQSSSNSSQGGEGNSSGGGSQGGGSSEGQQNGGNGGQGGNSQNGMSSSSGNSSSSQGQGGSSSSGNSIQSITVSELVPNATLASNPNDIDWTEISYLLENIYSTWPTINLDLQKQGISQEIINSFSVSLSGCVQSLKNKDKNNTLINLFNMYINLPKFISSVTEDNNTINLYNTKTNILNAYTLASTGDKWNDIVNSVIAGKDSFNEILNNENDENKKSSLQKTQVIIEDLERISKINDKNIFFMGYKNVIQQLETMSQNNNSKQ